VSGFPVQLATRVNLGPRSGNNGFRLMLVADGRTLEVEQPPADAEDGRGHFRPAVVVILRDGYGALAVVNVIKLFNICH